MTRLFPSWGLWEAAGVFALAYLGIAHAPAAGFTDASPHGAW